MNRRIIDRLKSLPLTILLTVLIWMYAEAQFTSSEEGLTVSIHAVSRDPDMAARIISPADGTFRISVEGSRGQVERFRQQSLGALAFSDSDLRAMVYYSDAKIPTSAALASVRVLNSLPFFRRNGLTVTSAAPAVVNLDVDRLKRFQEPTQWRGGITAPLTPALVEVAMPRRLYDSIGDVNKIHVYASTSQDLGALPLDQSSTVPVQFSVEYPAPPDPRVTVTPTSGTALFQQRRVHESTLEIHDLPVLVDGSAEMLSRSTITINPATVTVRLAGRADALAALRRQIALGQPALRVYLDIDDSDKFGVGMLRRTLRYVLPDGVAVQEGPQTVAFSLEPATPASAPAK